MLVARQSSHIQEDIKRNWSSWNFGQDGISCTESELLAGIEAAKEANEPIYISGFELYPNEVENSEIKELYPNYWVLVDNTNRLNGLSCINLVSENVNDAIKEIESISFSGDGNYFDAQSAKLAKSIGDIHIFEI